MKNNEAPGLGGGLAKGAALRGDGIYLVSVGVLIFLKCMLDKTTFNSHFPGSLTLHAMNLLATLTYLPLMAKIFFLTEYTRRERWLVLCGAVIAAACFLNTRELLVARAFLIFAGGKSVDFRRILKTALWALLLATSLTILLALTGAIKNRTLINRQDVSILRYSLGFSHPNILAGILLMICTFWFVVSYEKLQWWHYATCAGLIAFVYFVADSRSGEGALLALLALAAVGEKWNAFSPSRVWTRYLWLTIPLLAAASCALAEFYQSGMPVIEPLNRLLTGRIQNLNAYHREFGFSWFGQSVYNVRWLNGSVVSADSPGFDNAYVLTGIRYGLVPLILYCLSQALLVWKGGRVARAELIVCALTIGVYSFVESHAADICYNPAMLALPVLFPAQSGEPEDTMYGRVLSVGRAWLLRARLYR